MKKKLMSLSLALVMCLSLCVSTATAYDDLLSNFGETEIVHLNDGTTLTVSIIPATSTMDLHEIESGWARPTASITFSCTESKGSHAHWQTNNIGSSGDENMNVTCTFTIPGESPVILTKTVTPGNKMVVTAESQSGKGLKMDALTTIRAQNSAVHYSFSAEQY